MLSSLLNHDSAPGATGSRPPSSQRRNTRSHPDGESSYPSMPASPKSPRKRVPSSSSTPRAPGRADVLQPTPVASPNKAALDFISNPAPSGSTGAPGASQNTPIDLDGSDVEMDDTEGETVAPVDDDGDDADEAEEGLGEVEEREGLGDVEGEDDGEEGEEGEEEEEEDEEEEEEEDDEEDEESDDDDDDKSEDLEGGDREDFEVTGAKLSEGEEPSAVVKAEPGEPTASTEAGEAPAEDGETVNQLQVKKKKRRRSPSVDDMPIAPPPMKTIRLEHELDPGVETLEWNILEDARERGMVEDWLPVDDDKEVAAEMVVDPTVEAGDAPELTKMPGPPGLPGGGGGLFGMGDMDEDPEEIARRLEEKYKDAEPKKRSTKKKKKLEEAYDLTDAFIDDSELTIDAPTHFGKAKKEGFFVHAGPLELVEEEVPKAKPRGGARKVKEVRPTLTALTAKKYEGNGTASSPIAIDSDAEGAGPSKPAPVAPVSPSKPLIPEPIDRSLYKNAARDPLYLPPFPTFPGPVRDALLELRAQSSNHKWNPGEKAKFPEHLKKYLKLVAKAAYEHDMFGTREDSKALYTALTSCLPYNQFTLTKLIIKTAYAPYWEFLQACEDTGIEVLKELVANEEPGWRQRTEDALTAYQEELKQWKIEHPQDDSSTPAQVQTPTAVEPSSTLDAEDPENPTAEEASKEKDGGRPVEPKTRMVWTADIREVYCQLLENNQEMVSISAKAQEMNVPSVQAVKEVASRQKLYKRVTDIFPENSHVGNDVLSREMTRWKARKQKKEEAAEGNA